MKEVISNASQLQNFLKQYPNSTSEISEVIKSNISHTEKYCTNGIHITFSLTGDQALNYEIVKFCRTLKTHQVPLEKIYFTFNGARQVGTIQELNAKEFVKRVGDLSILYDLRMPRLEEWFGALAADHLSNTAFGSVNTLIKDYESTDASDISRKASILNELVKAIHTLSNSSTQFENPEKALCHLKRLKNRGKQRLAYLNWLLKEDINPVMSELGKPMQGANRLERQDPLHRPWGRKDLKNYLLSYNKTMAEKQQKVSFFRWLETQELDPKFIEADGKKKVTGIPFKVRYLSEEEKKAAQLYFLKEKEVVLADILGRQVDSKEATSLWSDEKRHIFVQGVDKTFYLYQHTQESDFNGIVHHHSTPVSGENTLSAGEMQICEGKLQLISNSSGHYKPSATDMLNALEELDKQGLDLSQVTLELVVREAVCQDIVCRGEIIKQVEVPAKKIKKYNALEFLQSRGRCQPKESIILEKLFGNWQGKIALALKELHEERGTLHNMIIRAHEKFEPVNEDEDLDARIYLAYEFLEQHGQAHWGISEAADVALIADPEGSDSEDGGY